MKGLTKFMIIFASILIFIGISFFAIGMVSLNWNFDKLSTAKYVTNTHDIHGDFSNISLKTTTADILFAPSDTGICKVVCKEKAKKPHSVSIENNTLTIKENNNKKWYDNIGIMISDHPEITVYLPKDTYSLLNISLTTGDVSLSDLTLDELTLSTTTGDISLSNISTLELNQSVSTGTTNLTGITCRNLVSTGTTGKINLTNVRTTGLLSVKRSTGNIHLDSCDGSDIKLKTTTGSVKGTLLSEKIFKAHSTTGSVSVPDTHTGGICDISVTTGAIKIEIAK